MGGNVRRLEGQVALVTGASMGMGKAIARALAAEGASVAITARGEDLLRQAADEIRSAGVDVLDCPADVSDPASVETMVGAVLEHFGRIDLLVNNAGVNLPHRSLSDITVEGWQTTVGINLSGPFLCTRAVLPAMRAQGRGTIVNVSSFSGKRPSVHAGVAYSASKAALNSFTESINLEERRNGIRACLVVPGEVNTPHVEKRLHPPSPEARAAMLQPEDVAAAVVFVATMPERATVEELIIRPTVLRNRDDDARAVAST